MARFVSTWQTRGGIVVVRKHAVAKYSDDQPRDERGRWADTRGAETGYAVPRGPSAARWAAASDRFFSGLPESFTKVLRGAQREAAKSLLNLNVDWGRGHPYPNEAIADVLRGDVTSTTEHVEDIYQGKDYGEDVTTWRDAKTGKEMGWQETNYYDQAVADIEALDKAFENPALQLSEDRVFYKGINAAVLADLGSGDIFSDRSFASAGVTPGTGMSVMGNVYGNRQVGMELFVAAGTPVIYSEDYSDLSSYNEVAFARGTRFRIIDQYTDPADYPFKGPEGIPGGGFGDYVRVEVLPPNKFSKSVAVNLAKYSDDQLRDDHGRWASGGVLPVDAAEETYRGEAAAALAEHLQGREPGSLEDLGVGTERYIQAAFSGPLPGGVESVARDAALNPANGSFAVMVDFFDDDGEKVGQASRHIDFATGRVEHAAMSLLAEVQGQDIAQEFNARAEAFYSEAGLTEVGLYANATVGGYAWATQGYDWDFDADPVNGATTEAQVAHIRYQLEGVEMGSLRSDAFVSDRRLPGNVSESTIAAAADLVERFGLPRDDPAFPKPIEVAALGVWDGPVATAGSDGAASRLDWHLGKAILMGNKWNAVKQL